MKLSIYTFVRNGLFFDYHVVEMLKHHVPLADEIIVNEGYSTDGTYEAIKDLDAKIKVHRFHWDRSDPATWHLKFKNQARQLCSGDWCILLDCDEFIPEWEFDRLRSHLERTEASILRVRYTHFYANYRVYQHNEEREMPPHFGWRIHRNLPDIQVIGDGSDVRSVAGARFEHDSHNAFECHHFGEVRHASRLRQKWHVQARQHAKNARWSWVPSFLFDVLPHRWLDSDILPRLHIYDGPLMRCVRDNPKEFVRDGLKVYKFLQSQGKGAPRGQESPDGSPPCVDQHATADVSREQVGETSS